MKLPEFKQFLLQRVTERTGDAQFMAGQRRMAEMLPVELQRYAPFLVFNRVTELEVQTNEGVWSFRFSPENDPNNMV